MRDMIPRKVVVGVVTADCLPTLQAAAQEAARRRCGVHLLHVLQPVYVSHPQIEELELIAGELQRAGAEVVDQAADSLERLMPEDLVVRTEVCHGAVVSSLVEVSAHACLLVVRHREERRRFLSITQAVAARAQCPVLVVPPTWHSEESGVEPWVVAAWRTRAAPHVWSRLHSPRRRDGMPGCAWCTASRTTTSAPMTTTQRRGTRSCA